MFYWFRLFIIEHPVHYMAIAAICDSGLSPYEQDIDIVILAYFNDCDHS